MLKRSKDLEDPVWRDQMCGAPLQTSGSTFTWLVDALRDRLHQQQTEMRAPVSVEQHIAVAVWWMANTMSFRTEGQQFGLVRSTMSGIIVDVTCAITVELLHRVVYLCNLDRTPHFGHSAWCQPGADGYSIPEVTM
ncbi:UNVERIFIED_CONTAM: hypothetical protein K2H54_060368 [Gekko kuhli]